MADKDPLSLKDVNKDLVEQTNRCVSCGLCLPHCPTYRLLKSEADSPRGRIAIINGVVTGRIPMNEKFELHLDRCLTCRACEAACPNHVAYGQIIDGARKMIQVSDTHRNAEYSTKPSQQRLLSMLSTLAIRPVWFDRLRWLLYLSQKSGLLSAIRRLWQYSFKNRSGRPSILSQLPPVVFPYTANWKKNRPVHTWRDFYPAIGESRGTVALFLGCVARLTDTATLNACIFVLTRFGYSVRVPSKQTCCGALHQHAGDAEKASQLRCENMQVFRAPDVVAVISAASGCGAQLCEYTERCATNQRLGAEKAEFPESLDISKFLSTASGWDQLVIAPLEKKVAVHDPCSLRYVLRDHLYPYQIIQKIPGAQMVVLADNDQCCGAAGTYFIRQPELATGLLDDKMQAIMQSGADLLVTSNVGCAMHIAAGLRMIGSKIEVIHPVTLLARQMQRMEQE
ncbi:(Fe-S)-binding protein [Nitrosomonas sp.]|uniref:(Fe-S)-binding protein n=1 Tax=Nitrosomonas sp. TaxID=42353 RepID=UPI00284DCBB5|nr:(Fe-S)-binding protein [Nitrosomonas sp.]MCP5243393.1 (Fe-S)-binding protein [Burkholderiales bacterium]MDR4514835.1 (Fe-S)-binding protein [Nitrosomonas sp.]